VYETGAVSTDGEPLGWIVDLSERDRWFVLPIVFAGLITLYIDMAFVRTRTQRLGVWAAVFPLFIATGALFSAGTDIYLVMSAALLIVQRLYVSGVPARLRLAWRRRGLGADLVPLDEPADKDNRKVPLSRLVGIHHVDHVPAPIGHTQLFKRQRGLDLFPEDRGSAPARSIQRSGGAV